MNNHSLLILNNGLSSHDKPLEKVDLDKILKEIEPLKSLFNNDFRDLEQSDKNSDFEHKEDSSREHKYFSEIASILKDPQNAYNKTLKTLKGSLTAEQLAHLLSKKVKKTASKTSSPLQNLEQKIKNWAQTSGQKEFYHYLMETIQDPSQGIKTPQDLKKAMKQILEPKTSRNIYFECPGLTQEDLEQVGSFVGFNKVPLADDIDRKYASVANYNNGNTKNPDEGLLALQHYLKQGQLNENLGANLQDYLNNNSNNPSSQKNSLGLNNEDSASQDDLQNLLNNIPGLNALFNLLTADLKGGASATYYQGHAVSFKGGEPLDQKAYLAKLQTLMQNPMYKKLINKYLSDHSTDLPGLAKDLLNKEVAQSGSTTPNPAPVSAFDKDFPKGTKERIEMKDLLSKFGFSIPADLSKLTQQQCGDLKSAITSLDAAADTINGKTETAKQKKADMNAAIDTAFTSIKIALSGHTPPTRDSFIENIETLDVKKGSLIKNLLNSPVPQPGTDAFDKDFPRGTNERIEMKDLLSRFGFSIPADLSTLTQKQCEDLKTAITNLDAATDPISEKSETSEQKQADMNAAIDTAFTSIKITLSGHAPPTRDSFIENIETLDVKKGALIKQLLNSTPLSQSAFDKDFPKGTEARVEMKVLLTEFGISIIPDDLNKLTQKQCEDLKSAITTLDAAAVSINKKSETPEQKKADMNAAIDKAFSSIQGVLSSLSGYKPSNRDTFITNLELDVQSVLIKQLLNSTPLSQSAFDKDFPKGTEARVEMKALLTEFGISITPDDLNKLTQKQCDDLKSAITTLDAAVVSINKKSETPEQKKADMNTAIDKAFSSIQGVLSPLSGYKPSDRDTFITNLEQSDVQSTLIKQLLNSTPSSQNAFDKDFPKGSEARAEMLALLAEFGISTNSDELTQEQCDNLKSSITTLDAAADSINGKSETPEEKQADMNAAIDKAFSSIQGVLSSLSGYKPSDKATFIANLENWDVKGNKIYQLLSVSPSDQSAFYKDFPQGAEARTEILALLAEFGITTNPDELTQATCDDLKSAITTLDAAAVSINKKSETPEQKQAEMNTAIDKAFSSIQGTLKSLPGYSSSNRTAFLANIKKLDVQSALIQQLLNLPVIPADLAPVLNGLEDWESRDHHGYISQNYVNALIQAIESGKIKSKSGIEAWIKANPKIANLLNLPASVYGQTNPPTSDTLEDLFSILGITDTTIPREVPV